MPDFTLSRRTLMSGAAALMASTALPVIGFAQTPKKGGRLVVAADSEPRNLNPAIVASNGVFFISSKIVEQLAEADYTAKDWLSPRLAVSWEGAADGLSATFRLREGVKWHDGKPFTSADVAFSALDVWKPLQNLGRTVFKDLQAVDTPDEHTAVFKFSKPTPFQLIRNALPALTSVLPRHVYETGKIEAAAQVGAVALLVARDVYPARQDAAAARSMLAETSAPVLIDVGAFGAPALDWLSGLTGEVALALSRTDADRAPLVRVETGVSLSAIRAAYELYGDANRAGELIARNRVATAAYMPAAFEALDQ